MAGGNTRGRGRGRGRGSGNYLKAMHNGGQAPAPA